MLGREDFEAIRGHVETIRNELICVRGCDVCRDAALAIADWLQDYVKREAESPEQKPAEDSDFALRLIGEVIENSAEPEAKALEQVRAEMIRLRGVVALGTCVAVLAKRAWYAEESPRPEVVEALKAAQKFSEAKS